MPLSLAWPTLAVVLAAILLGGLVKGVAGFGYAVTSTALLAVLLDPAAAVTVMILPTLVANVPLLSGLELDDLAACIRRFWPFVAAALVGTLAGMAVLDRVPKAGLGLVTFAYVLTAQPYRELPGSGSFATRLFRPGTATKLWMGLARGWSSAPATSRSRSSRTSTGRRSSADGSGRRSPSASRPPRRSGCSSSSRRG